MNGNGSVTEFEQSSQLDPGTKVVAGTTVAPVEEVIVYPTTQAVGVAVGGVPVRVGVAVPAQPAP